MKIIEQNISTILIVEAYEIIKIFVGKCESKFKLFNLLQMNRTVI